MAGITNEEYYVDAVDLKYREVLKEPEEKRGRLVFAFDRAAGRKTRCCEVQIQEKSLNSRGRMRKCQSELPVLREKGSSIPDMNQKR